MPRFLLKLLERVIEDQSLETMPEEGSREFGYESWAFCPPHLKAERNKE